MTLSQSDHNKFTIPELPKTLVIFDLNGIFVHRDSVTKVFENIPDSSRLAYGFPPHMDIMLWTSITKKNAGPIIRKLEKIWEIKFFKVWYRSNCLPHPHRGISDIPDWAIYKPLFLIRQKFPQYDRVLLIDDSMYKMYSNNPSQYLICRPEYGIDYLYASILFKLGLSKVNPKIPDENVQNVQNVQNEENHKENTDE